MDLLKQIVARAQSDKQRIVLPEAEEERTLKAADRALQDGLADIILIGNPENIRKEAEEWGLKNIDKATIVDPKNNPRCEEYAEKLAELRKKKGMTIEQARKLVTENNLYLGCIDRSRPRGPTARSRVRCQPRERLCVPPCRSSSVRRASLASVELCSCSPTRRQWATMV